VPRHFFPSLRQAVTILLLGAVLSSPFVAMAMGLASAGTAPAQFGALVVSALPLFAGLFGSTALCRRASFSDTNRVSFSTR